MEHRSIQRFIAIVTASFVFLGLVHLLAGFGHTVLPVLMGLDEGSNNTLPTILHRKLLHADTAMVEPNRIWGSKCSMTDIVITQGPTTPLPNGIPTYTVDIMNMCASLVFTSLVVGSVLHVLSTPNCSSAFTITIVLSMMEGHWLMVVPFHSSMLIHSFTHSQFPKLSVFDTILRKLFWLRMMWITI